MGIEISIATASVFLLCLLGFYLRKLVKEESLDVQIKANKHNTRIANVGETVTIFNREYKVCVGYCDQCAVRDDLLFYHLFCKNNGINCEPHNRIEGFNVYYEEIIHTKKDKDGKPFPPSGRYIKASMDN